MRDLTDLKLRIRVNTDSFDNPIDVLHGGIPQYWRGNDLRIELGIFAGDDVVNVSNFSCVTLAVRALNNDGEAPSAGAPILLSGECSVLDNSVTQESWESGEAQHAVFNFPAQETGLLPGDYWLSIWAQTNDVVAKTLTLGAGLIHVLENGGGDSIEPPEPMSQYYTVSEADTRFVSMEAIDPDTNLGDSDDKIATQHAVKAYVDGKPEFGESNTASNLGDGIGLFKEKVEVDLQFKSLQAGDNVSIAETSNTITISTSTGGGGTGGSGDFVKLMRVEVTTPGYYITCNPIFDASLYDSYVVYFNQVMPTANDVKFGIQCKNGTLTISGGSSYTTFRSGAYSTTYESEEETSSVMYMPMYGIASQSVVSGATGISGQLSIIGTNSTTFKTRMFGSATGHSTTGGPATLFSFSGGLNTASNTDGFRLLFSSGYIASGSATVFGVKK